VYRHPALETGEILQSRLRPKDLGQCASARPHLPLERRFLRCLLRPVVELPAENVLRPAGRDAVKRIEGIRPLQSDDPVLFPAREVVELVAFQILRIVKVAVAGRAQDRITPRLGRRDRAFFSTPAHHDGAIRNRSFMDDFIPAYGAAAFLCKICGNLRSEQSLEILLRLGAFFGHAGPASATARPPGAVNFIAAYVNQFSREKPAHLVKDILDKLDRPLAAKAERASDASREVLFSAHVATQPLQRSHRGTAVARHLDFGNDRYVEFLGVCNYFQNIGFGI